MGSRPGREGVAEVIREIIVIYLKVFAIALPAIFAIAWAANVPSLVLKRETILCLGTMNQKTMEMAVGKRNR